MMKKIILILVYGLVIFLTLVPRSVSVTSKNFVFGFDQGREYLRAKDIAVNHKLTLIGTEIGGGYAAFSGLFHGPFYYYLLTIPFILFNGDPYGGVVLMLVLGIATVYISYLLGRKIFGNFGGIVTGLLVAISPPLLAQAYFIWSPHASSLFIVLALYFTFLLYTQKRIAIFLAAFFTGFVYNFETATAVPMSFALLLYSFFIFRKRIHSYAILITGFLLSYLPMIIFEVRHDFLAISGIIRYFTNGAKSISSSEKPHNYVLEHFQSFAYNFYDTFPRQSFIPIIVIFTLVLGATIYFLVKEKEKKIKYFLLYLLILPVITFVIFSPLKDNVYQYYLYHLCFVYILFFVYVLHKIYVLNLLISKIVFSFILLLFLFIAIPFSVKTYTYMYSDYGGDAKIKGKMDALEYIYKDANGKPFGLLIFSPPVYTYPYDYLIGWYGQRKYNYIPYQDKKGTFYLLMEVDPYKQWSYKGWQETVIKTGTIIYTKKLSSGIIIQKRLEAK